MRLISFQWHCWSPTTARIDVLTGGVHDGCFWLATIILKAIVDYCTLGSGLSAWQRRGTLLL